MTKQSRFSIAVSLMVLAACQPKMAADASMDIDSNKSSGGVIVSDLAMEDITGAVGPEVALVFESPVRHGDVLEFHVEPLQVRLDAENCQSVACRALGSRFGQQHRLLLNCTGSFVTNNFTVLTAAHCLRGAEFANTYGIVGFHADVDWPVHDGKIQVPVKNVVRMCHVERCRHESGDDLAMVHVCAYDPAMEVVKHGAFELAPAQVSLEDPLWVHSHALGLPAKRYSAVAEPGSSRLMYFTNFGGGSGGVVVNARQQVVALVRGADPGGIVACAQGDLKCKPQEVTPLTVIHALLATSPPGQCMNRDILLPTSHERPCIEAKTQ